MPADVITVAMARTKAAKLFQMSGYNIITLSKQSSQRGSSRKVITGLWRITEPFFSKAQELVSTSWVQAMS